MTKASPARVARKRTGEKHGKSVKTMEPAGAVFIAMPTYDGKNDTALTEALLREVPLLLADRWIVGFGRVEHNAIIASARNLLCDRFMKSWWTFGSGERRPYTDLLFIDADVTFEPGAIARILSHDVDVVFGCPPMKTDLEQYPCEFERDEGGYAFPDKESGLIAMTHGPAGFLRIRRAALETLTAAGLAPEIVDRNCYGAELLRYKAFFHVDHVGDRQIGEDVYFYERFRSTGAKVWLDPLLGFDHSGMTRRRGNIGDYLTARQAEEEDRKDTERRVAEGARAAKEKQAADAAD